MNWVIFFFINIIFLYKENSLEACFLHRNSFILTNGLNKVRTKLKNVVKSFEMTLNSKHGTEKIKNKNKWNRNMKNQNTERQKTSFTKRIGIKCRLI